MATCAADKGDLGQAAPCTWQPPAQPSVHSYKTTVTFVLPGQGISSDMSTRARHAEACSPSGPGACISAHMLRGGQGVYLAVVAVLRVEDAHALGAPGVGGGQGGDDDACNSAQLQYAIGPRSGLIKVEVGARRVTMMPASTHKNGFSRDVLEASNFSCKLVS